MFSRDLKIACIGECMGELASDGKASYTMAFAGDTFNTAYYLAKIFANTLGAGFSQHSASTATAISYVTVVGEDTLSRDMHRFFTACGLNTQMVFTDSERTVGLYMINNDERGERTFSYWRSTSAARNLMKENRAALLEEALQGFDLIYLSGISLAILEPADRSALINLLSRLKIPVAFDPNYRPLLWSSVQACRQCYQAVAPLCRYVLATLDDEQALWGITTAQQAAQFWRDSGAQEIAIKNGGEPNLIFTDTMRHFPLPNVVTKPIDTTGAGDAFNAAYLSHRLQGLAVASAVDSAQQLCSRVISQRGAIISDDH